MRHSAPNNRLSLSAALIFATLTCALRTAAAQDPNSAETLTNQSVVQMVMGKVPKDLILSKIRFTKSAFDVTVSGLGKLHQSKVDKEYIKEMIKAASSPGSNTNTEVLTNEAVMALITNQVPRDIILVKIQNTKPGYDLTANGLVALNQNKVPQEVVKGMMAATAMAVSSAPTAASAPAANPAPAPSDTKSARGSSTPTAEPTKSPPGATFTDKDFEKVVVTRNPDDVKGKTKVGDVSASASKASGDQAALREAATVKLKHETAKKGASIVLIQVDNYATTPTSTVKLSGVAYK
jgi:hypothetical protein